METGNTTRVSPGSGKTTCSFINPETGDILFASTHHDPRSRQLQDEELKFRASGQERRYSWDYDPEMELYVRSKQTGAYRRLTNKRGYDAEASYSPDGQWIVFSSTRDAYDRNLSAAERKQLDTDPSYFGEIYIMPTATRIESTEKARLMSSTRTTVAQKADRPSHGFALGAARRSVPSS